MEHISANGSGRVHIVATLPRPQMPKQHYTLDLERQTNTHPGSVKCLAWTGDGYALAVGYEHAWAIWSMGGRLSGWGREEEAKEGFMRGVDHLVRSTHKQR